MKEPLKIALVSYLNTRPFTDAIESHIPSSETELLLLPPAECAEAIADGRADIALVPAGALNDLSGIRILPDYCLGASGAVGSVFLFGQVPVQEMETVYLDPHSRTSNGLVRILFQHLWKKEVSWQKDQERPFAHIQEATGGVAIGDEAIRHADQYAYVYDLSAEWEKLTGWPFVFAVWVFRPEKVNSRQLEMLKNALDHAPAMAAASAEKWAATYGISEDFAKVYLQEKMQYRFDATKHHAFQTYLQLLRSSERRLAHS